MTRDEHLAWAKERALEYWREGDLLNAVTSMGSDLDKHDELRPNPYLLMAGAWAAQDGDRELVKRWIEGFR
jgi:hypothetical protein